MKFHVKLLYGFTLLAFGGVIALMWYLMLADPLPVKKLSDIRINTLSPLHKIALFLPVDQPLPRWQEQQFAALIHPDTPEERIITVTAEKSILALLPENSFILRRHPVKLLDAHLAEVSGQAGTQSSSGDLKCTWDYRVKIRFFPQEYAEAEFPEIQCTKQR